MSLTIMVSIHLRQRSKLSRRQGTSVTELRSFLRQLNFYHKFIPDLSTILAPLHKLLLKASKWSWSQLQEEAFNQAKSLP